MDWTIFDTFWRIIPIKLLPIIFLFPLLHQLHYPALIYTMTGRKTQRCSSAAQPEEVPLGELLRWLDWQHQTGYSNHTKLRTAHVWSPLHPDVCIKNKCRGGGSCPRVLWPSMVGLSMDLAFMLGEKTLVDCTPGLQQLHHLNNLLAILDDSREQQNIWFFFMTNLVPEKWSESK